jgi:hypothetical protein
MQMTSLAVSLVFLVAGFAFARSQGLMASQACATNMIFKLTGEAYAFERTGNYADAAPRREAAGIQLERCARMGPHKQVVDTLLDATSQYYLGTVDAHFARQQARESRLMSKGLTVSLYVVHRTMLKAERAQEMFWNFKSLKNGVWPSEADYGPAFCRRARPGHIPAACLP